MRKRARKGGRAICVQGIHKVGGILEGGNVVIAQGGIEGGHGVHLQGRRADDAHATNRNVGDARNQLQTNGRRSDLFVTGSRSCPVQMKRGGDITVLSPPQKRLGPRELSDR